MVNEKDPTLLDIWKVVIINKTKLDNHLHHHELWFKCILAPIGVGVFINICLGIALVLKTFLG